MLIKTMFYLEVIFFEALAFFLMPAFCNWAANIF